MEEQYMPAKATLLALGENVEGEMEGSILHIRLDMSRNLYLTAAKPDANGRMRGGGNNMNATTHGNIIVPGTRSKLMVNLYTPATA